MHRLRHIADFADDIHAPRPWRHIGVHRGSRGGFSIGRILLAGLAVVAFIKLLSAANRPNRSTAEKVVLGALILTVGAVVLSFYRSAQRDR